MTTRELHSWARLGLEPPRDGEFGLQAELSSEERIAGLVETATAWKFIAFMVVLWGIVLRYPVLTACLAISLGVVISSLIMISPPSS